MSHAFENAGNDCDVKRGGKDAVGAREGELVDSRGQEVEVLTQQPASKREASGRKGKANKRRWHLESQQRIKRARGGGGTTRGNMTTSRQTRGKREGRRRRFHASLYQNTTQQSNEMEVLADMRCWWVQGGVVGKD